MSDNCYRQMYDKVAQMHCTPEKLAQIKDYYVDEINSRRRYDAIKTLAQLLKVLEKRDVLNRNSSDVVFTFLATVCDDNSVMNMISCYNTNNNNVNNETFVASPSATTSTRVLPEYVSDRKLRVYKIIATEIGDKWKDLARALNIPEGLIDELDKKHSSISESVHEVLVYNETNNSRTWKSFLLEALSEARRNDLRRRLQKIFDDCV